MTQPADGLDLPGREALLAALAALADEPLSDCFGVAVQGSRDRDRWTARAAPSW